MPHILDLQLEFPIGIDAPDKVLHQTSGPGLVNPRHRVSSRPLHRPAVVIREEDVNSVSRRSEGKICGKCNLVKEVNRLGSRRVHPLGLPVR